MPIKGWWRRLREGPVEPFKPAVMWIYRVSVVAAVGSVVALAVGGDTVGAESAAIVNPVFIVLFAGIVLTSSERRWIIGLRSPVSKKGSDRL